MKNLVEILRDRALNSGEKTAFRFYEDDRAGHALLSWRELEARVAELAAFLQSKNAENERVLLLCPTGSDFIAGFMACLSAGAVAVPLYPPRSNRNLQRIEAVVKNSAAKFALTTAPVIERIRRFENAGIFNKIEFLSADSVEDFDSRDVAQKRIASSQTAFLQYTSGSTGKPKGVIITHENLMHNQEAIKRAFDQNEDSIIVSWLPLFHDMGLIGNVLQTIYTGSNCVLIPPSSFLQKPILWLKAISDFRATTAGAPTFGYDLCGRIKESSDTENLDLASWRTAFCGAEPVRGEILRNFARRFAANGFSEKAFAPCYGLAEATLLVSARSELKEIRIDREALLENRLKEANPVDLSAEIATVADCGKPATDLKVEIVNPKTRLRSDENEIGEIWVSGKSVAAGYWQNEVAAKKTFRAQIKNTTGDNFLRTGDLGFKLDNSVYITGRLKDLIIVRGRNFYPADLEYTAFTATRSEITTIAAIGLPNESGEKVWMIAEANGKTDFPKLAAQIVKKIAEEHDLRLSAIAFVRRGAIPKTSSGKIMRSRCRELLQMGEMNALYTWDENAFPAEQNEIEETDCPQTENDAKSILKKITAERLGIEAERIADEDLPVELGIDSLTATQISHLAQEKYNLNVSVANILSGGSLQHIATQATFEKPENNQYRHFRDNSSDEVSYGQKALYFLQQLEPRNAAYNVSVAVELENKIDADLLEKAIQNAAVSTEQIRSNFKQIENRIRRTNRNDAHFNLQRFYLDLPFDEFTKKISRVALKPFNLESDWLLRAHLFRNERQNQNVLLLTAHHIICDFWSLRLLAEEIGENYTQLLRGQELVSRHNNPRFSEFVSREKDFLAGEGGEKLWDYWKNALAGEIEPLDLPIDFPRLAKQSCTGAAHSFEISSELTERLDKTARKNGVTLFAVVLTAYQILLSKYAGQKKFLVGIPLANRVVGEEAKTFGYFVNTLPASADFTENPIFSEALSIVSREVRQAEAHAAFPFALIVERLGPKRDSSRPPLFQAIFSWQQTAHGDKNWSALALGKLGAKIELGKLSCHSFALERHAAQFDLALQAANIENRLNFVWQYCADVFKAETIGRMTAHFSHLLKEIAECDTKNVAAYDVLPEAERIAQIELWNATERDYPKDVLLHELIEKQVGLTPHNVALEFEGRTLTYAELNAKANQLAHFLRRRGARPETIIGVALERSLELVIALLATLKSGAAYLPLDPSYPRERFDYMLADAFVNLLITNEKISAEKQIGAGVEKIFLNEQSEIFTSEETENPARVGGPANAAYVIYTSGSTGKPKGAINSHANIVNRLLWMQEAFCLNKADSVLQKTPFSFDVSVWEFFWTLMFGARLVVAKPGGHTDSQYLLQTIKKKKITTLHFVPSLLNLFLQEAETESVKSVKRVTCSGEALPPELERDFFKKFKTAELFNLYGPTEAAIDVSWHVCRRENGLSSVPIGKPIANTQLYVLDEKLAAVPVGVAGELYIGGANVGRGYLNKPGLTAEKFIPDPFIREKGARLYRTGDVARYLTNGSIDYLERRDGQIKLRGQRIELGEIQTVLRTHPEISETVVIARTELENKHVSLVAYYLAEKELTFDELREFLQRRLPPQMIPNYFVRLEKLPLSPNGKLDRKNLPSPKTAGRFQRSISAAPCNEIERILTNVFETVLGVKNVGVDDNFFSLGGDSIRSIQIRAAARENGLDFELHELFRHQTVRALAAVIRRYRKEDESRRNGLQLSADDRKNLPENVTRAYPLTRLQTGLVFHAEHDRDYEIYLTSLRVRARFDAAAMRKAVRIVTERHEILRTSFDLSEFSEPLQLVSETVEPNFRVEDLTQTPAARQREILAEWLKNERANSFDWRGAPLARFTVHQFSPDSFHLTLSEPVLDGWSVATLLNELLTIYAALSETQNPPAMPLPPPFSDYVALETEALVSERQRTFWHKNLEDFNGCELLKTTDNDSLSHTTERIYIKVPAEVSQRVSDFAGQKKLPLKSVLLAAHLLAVSISTAQTDVATALLYNGRPETELGTRAVGLFLNAMPFRLDLENLSFTEIAEKALVAETDLLPNRRFPLSEILRLHGKRTLFDTAFNYTHFHAYQSLHSIENIKIEDIYASDQTYFPLTAQFNLDHESDAPNIRLALDFRPAKISALDARLFADRLLGILQSIDKEELRKPVVRKARATSSEAVTRMKTLRDDERNLSELLERIEAMSDDEARLLKEELIESRN